MVAMSADGTFDPMDPNFTPPSGNDFDVTVMGRTPAAALARRNQAFTYFQTTYGIDFNTAIQLNPSTWITPDNSVLLVYAMTDPRYNYKLNSISGVRLAPVGGDIAEAVYLMAVVNPAGATLFGTYGGAGGVAVPEGTAALHGEIYTTVPILCSDSSIDMESFYMMYQSLEPVMANQQDKVIYNDEVVANDRFIGTGFAFSRKGIRVLPSGTDFQAWVTNIVTFYP